MKFQNPAELTQGPAPGLRAFAARDIARLVAFLIAFVGVPGFADAHSGGLINDSDSSIIYSTAGDEGTGPTWFLGNTTNDTQHDYMEDEHYSNFTTNPVFQIYGAAMVVNFTGTGITWIGSMGPNFGIASYSVDGGDPLDFDAYSPTRLVQNPNVMIPNLSNESHSLKIEVTPSKNPSSSNYYQVIDAFNITGSPLPLNQATDVAGYSSPELIFSPPGEWTCGPSGNDLSGGHCFTSAPNASVSWTFSGSLVEVFGRPNAENGFFNVFIDDTSFGQVDSHFGASDIDQLNGYPLFQAKIAPGTHTIKIVNTGLADPAALGTFTQIDMFVAFP